MELSYLSQREQETLLDAMEEFDCTPSHAQARELKAYSRQGALDETAIRTVLEKEKANQKERIRIPVERIRSFFPKSYTVAQMEEAIIRLCEANYRKKQQNRDAR